MKKEVKRDFVSQLEPGLRYPWNNPSRLLPILWLLVPIIGWFALAGYLKKIVQGLVKGNKTELPAFGNFWTNFREGAVVFIALLVFSIVLSLMNVIPFVGKLVYYIILIFIYPWLTINYLVKGNFNALLEFEKAYNLVFGNAKEYLMIFALSLAYWALYGALSWILIGIPAMTFGSLYFLTDFYKLHH